MFECPTCHLIFNDIQRLSRHIGHSKNHISIQEYYDLYYKKENEGKCLKCGLDTKFEGLTRGYFKYCCKKCSCSSDIRNKKIFAKLNESLIKRKNTCLINYGVDNPMLVDKFKEKRRKTCLEHFGVDNPMQSKEIREKGKQTCLEKYGVDNVFKFEIFKDKIKQTNLRNCGFIFSSQNKENRKKYKRTCLEKYGVDNPSKTFENRKRYRETFLRDLSNQKNNGLPIKGRIGKFEIQCLNELQKYSCFEFKRLQIIGYLPDCYISELNLIIEFNEEFHNQFWCIKKDLKKFQDLKFYLNCTFFIIKKKDWLQYKDCVIKKFLKLLVILMLKKLNGELLERTDK